MPWKIETHGEDMLKRFVHEGLRCLMGRDDDDDDDSGKLIMSLKVWVWCLLDNFIWLAKSFEDRQSGLLFCESRKLKFFKCQATTVLS